MKASKQNLSLWFSLLMVSTTFSQTTNQIQEIQYSTAPKSHARALAQRNDTLYIGSSLGEISFAVLSTGKVYPMENTNFPEVRDLEICGNTLFAMCSGDTSAVVRYDLTTHQKISSQLFNGVFLDGMAHYAGQLFLMGDPVNDTLSLFDWSELNQRFSPHPIRFASKEGEAAFAASGSTVHFTKDGQRVFVTGGNASRLFQTEADQQWAIQTLPYTNCPSCGPYSMSVQGKTWILVGGDYTQPNEGKGSCFYSTNEGQVWKKARKPPRGYRSSVVSNDKMAFSGGTNGLDISKNGGKKWKKYRSGNYFALLLLENCLIASSTDGKIIVFKW